MKQRMMSWLVIMIVCVAHMISLESATPSSNRLRRATTKTTSAGALARTSRSTSKPPTPTYTDEYSTGRRPVSKKQSQTPSRSGQKTAYQLGQEAGSKADDRKRTGKEYTGDEFERDCIEILTTYADEAKKYIDYIKDPHVKIESDQIRKIETLYKDMASLYNKFILKGFESQAALEAIKKMYQVCDDLWAMHQQQEKGIYFGRDMRAEHGDTYMYGLEDYLNDHDQYKWSQTLSKIQGWSNQADLDGSVGHQFEKIK